MGKKILSFLFFSLFIFINKTSLVAEENKTYVLGQEGPAGGIIFLTPSCEGNKTGMYFELAPVKTEKTLRWSIDFINIEQNELELGTGKTNTEEIIINQVESKNYAASYCNSLETKSTNNIWLINFNSPIVYSDWFLPSVYEFSHLLSQESDLSTSCYWTSSNKNTDHAYAYSKFRKVFYGFYKISVCRVRCIRAFEYSN